MSTSTAAVESGAIITYLYAFSGEWGSTRASNATRTHTHTHTQTQTPDSPRLAAYTDTLRQRRKQSAQRARTWGREMGGGKKDGAQ